MIHAIDELWRVRRIFGPRCRLAVALFLLAAILAAESSTADSEPSARSAQAAAAPATGVDNNDLDPELVALLSDVEVDQETRRDRQFCVAREAYDAGDLSKALAEFEQLLDIWPDSPIPHAYLARVLYDLRRYDDFTKRIKQAIYLHAGDAGNDYATSRDEVLSAEAIAHGTTQLRRMLVDRPAMAEHVSPGDELWNWTVRKFAGEDTGLLVEWDAADPSPLEACFQPEIDKGRARIRVRAHEGELFDKRMHGFDNLWSKAVFELHNVAESYNFEQVSQAGAIGTISRDEYVLGHIRCEERTIERTRAFYVKLYLPWARSRNYDPPAPDTWFCFEFPPDNVGGKELWQSHSHWTYYSASFDLMRAYIEFNRGNFARMQAHLGMVENGKHTLQPDQCEHLEYLKGQAWKLYPYKPEPQSFFAR